MLRRIRPIRHGSYFKVMKGCLTPKIDEKTRFRVTILFSVAFSFC
jgi:hypothetical protein